jgi:type VI protein secretion system component VasF
MSKQISHIVAAKSLLNLAGRWREYAAETDDADFKAMMLRTAEALEQAAAKAR